MNPRTTTSYYARESARAHRELADARADANRFRALLAETDDRLRQAWRAGRLPDGIIPADLIERTRAALAGEEPGQMSTDDVVAEAVKLLAEMPGASVRRA